MPRNQRSKWTDTYETRIHHSTLKAFAKAFTNKDYAAAYAFLAKQQPNRKQVELAFRESIPVRHHIASMKDGEFYSTMGRFMKLWSGAIRWGDNLRHKAVREG